MLHPILKVKSLSHSNGISLPDFMPTRRSVSGSLNYGIAIAVTALVGENCSIPEHIEELDLSVLGIANNNSQDTYIDIAAEVLDKNTGTTYITRYRPMNGTMETAAGINGNYKQFHASEDANLISMIALLAPIIASAIFTPSGRPHPFIEVALNEFQQASTKQEKSKAIFQISDLITKNIVSKNEEGVLIVQERTTYNPVNVEELKKASGEMFVRQGNPQILNIASGEQAESNIDNSFGTVKKEFEEYTQSLKWTLEEEKLIPQFKDDFPVPAETLKFARRFLHSRDAIRPMVQFMWRGPTSYGKSTGVECLAALLHTPLVKTTCHPNMETSDFLADFVPDTSTAKAENMPTFEEMDFDSVGAYYNLTGEYKDTATPQDCLEAYAAKAHTSDNTPRFKFVESNYVKALSRGYICEVQEASRIRNAGVLVGLNEFDRPGSVIPLLNGSYVKRHQNAIVIFTDNIGYASCRPLDPSVLRRMAFIVDSGELSKTQLFARAKYNTGCKNNQVLQKAYNIYSKVMEYAQKNDMMDEGSISATEFEMMVQCAMMEPEQDMKDIAQDCLVSKASSDPEMQETLMNLIACI